MGGGRLDLLAFLQRIPKKAEVCTLLTADRHSGSGMSRGFGELKGANLAQGQRSRRQKTQPKIEERRRD